jgi:hypothetical protein
MIKDIIILGAYLLIVTGLVQWMLYYTYKSIRAIQDAKAAYKEWKQAEKTCEDYMKDIQKYHKRCQEIKDKNENK